MLPLLCSLGSRRYDADQQHRAQCADQVHQNLIIEMKYYLSAAPSGCCIFKRLNETQAIGSMDIHNHLGSTLNNLDAVWMHSQTS